MLDNNNNTPPTVEVLPPSIQVLRTHQAFVGMNYQKIYLKNIVRCYLCLDLYHRTVYVVSVSCQ